MKDLSSTFNSEFQSPELRRFFKAMLGLAPLVALVIGTNLAIDPAYFYHHEQTEEMAATLVSSGHNALIIRAIHDRLFHKYLIGKQTAPKDVLILGTSKLIQVGNNVFGNLNVLNHCLSGANLNDMLGIYGMYRRKGILPKKILIEANPSLVNREVKTANTEWKLFSDEVVEMKELLGFPMEHATLFEEYRRPPAFLSPSYFQNSLDWINERLTPPPALPPGVILPPRDSGPPVVLTTLDQADSPIYLKDGSYAFPKARIKAVDDAESEAIALGTGKLVPGLETEGALDEQLRLTLERWIEYLLTHGTEVTLLLAPYHPAAYTRLIERENTRVLLKNSEYFLSLKRLGARVVGSYNPAAMGYDRTDFMDSNHLKRTSIARIQKEELFP